MNRYRMFFVQTSTWPPNMHLKLTKHGRFCKHNNQLPTKSHVELEDNSNVVSVILCFFCDERELSHTNVPLIHPTHKLDPYNFVDYLSPNNLDWTNPESMKVKSRVQINFKKQPPDCTLFEGIYDGWIWSSRPALGSASSCSRKVWLFTLHFASLTFNGSRQLVPKRPKGKV